MHSQSTLTLSH